jgi:hypothetical protein
VAFLANTDATLGATEKRATPGAPRVRTLTDIHATLCKPFRVQVYYVLHSAYCVCEPQNTQYAVDCMYERGLV